jgi:hypothetical protein
VVWQDDGSQYGTPGAVIGTGLTGWPSTKVKTPRPTMPFHLVLDGKDGATVAAGFAEAHVWDFGAGVTTPDDLTPDDRSGFILQGDEIGTPRRRTVPPSTELLVFSDIRTRMAEVQVWFDSYAELSAPNVLRRFLEITTNPDTGEKTGRPARLSDDDNAAFDLLNTPADQRSPAALTFGRPHLFFKGGPKKFIQNRGRAGDFEALNDIESFSSAPTKIPILS